jgi:protein tyrosine phosphatase (PTP) superfamily phosphohydrolase (DUF442 family)
MSFDQSFEQLSQIAAFVPVSPQLATSGQPTQAQFELIKAAGYEVVVNLAMPTSTHWVPEEEKILADLGLDYFHIPVLWENPTLEDFTQFCAVLEANQERKLWVHCAQNMRGSAMVYLYNRLRANLAHEVAWRYVEPVWQPNTVWFGFIEATLALHEV